MSSAERIEEAYSIAKNRYTELDVDTEKAMGRLSEIAISLRC